MNTEAVKRYFYWINERERVRIKKDAGKPAPWTKDPILQQYKFTNVFRQDDATTRIILSFLNNWAFDEPDDGLTLFNVCAFRLFNWAPTYQHMGGWITKYSETKWKRELHAYKDAGNKVFTGAYIITNNGLTDDKIDLYCSALKEAWKKRNSIAKAINTWNTVEDAVRILSNNLPMVGKFVAYELACDLTYTPLLIDADDRYTWANPGPGAKRGLNRIFRGSKDAKPKPASDAHYIEEMRTLYTMLPRKLHKHVKASRWLIDMRVIENALCEFDKYERVRLGEGRPRSKYKGERK